ncbi:hypothetical protein [Microbaculum marinum]|uniref:Uncharacterized protein n=1 Tax=Microbaculum marinum TaxID=1764581 RepID=A0AAW9RNG2_9HYPH
MPRDIDRKLRATAALLGAATCKDLAAEFRRVNPNTVFEVSRAYKWLQGRAQPRDARLYQDWARVIDLGRPGSWISDCTFEEFVEAVRARLGHDPDAVRGWGDPSGRIAADVPGDSGSSLAGTYVCYSHAWSPYFSGRIIRGELSIAQRTGPGNLFACLSECLPTGTARLEGQATMAGSSLFMHMRETGGLRHVFFSLFAPTPPVSVLAGLMCGTTIIDPEARPSATRIVMIRLPAPSGRLRSEVAYLAEDTSIAADLMSLGASIADPATADTQLTAFLAGGRGGGLDQISAAAYRGLVDIFDPAWLGPLPPPRRAPETLEYPVTAADAKAAGL